MSDYEELKQKIVRAAKAGDAVFLEQEAALSTERLAELHEYIADLQQETGVKIIVVPFGLHVVTVTDTAYRERAEQLEDALRTIRFAGYNDHATVIWMQKLAAHAMEPDKWPHPGAQQPPVEDTRIVRLEAALRKALGEDKNSVQVKEEGS
jgi:hypothetical protein